jgi:hypothetical protein
MAFLLAGGREADPLGLILTEREARRQRERLEARRRAAGAAVARLMRRAKPSRR